MTGVEVRSSASRRVGARGVWPWRDFPSVVWLVAVVLVTLVHPFLPHSRWLMVHLVLLGALTHAAVVWSTHFAQALLKTSPDLDPRPRQSARSGALFVGVSAVFVGVTGEVWWLTVAGAVLASASVLWHAVALARRLRHTLAPRFVVTVRYYLLAAIALPVGAILGVLLARGPDDAWRGQLLVAHTCIMALGWVGLTVTGTLVTLWPTMLRTRMDDRAEAFAAQALPALVVGVALTATGALAGVRWVAVAGLTAYLLAVLWWGRALWRPARTRAPKEMATASVSAALGWALAMLGWLVVLVATRADWASVGGAYGLPTAILAGAFAPQLLIGALSYLVPSVMGGGPAAVRAAQAEVDRYAVVRLVVVNAGVLLSLLPVPSVVRVLLTTLVLLAYATFVPLLARAIRASLRARVDREALLAAPRTDTAPRRVDIWSTGQFVAALGLVSLVVALGVLADPAGSGVLPRSSAPGGEVAASGRTTTVRVVAKDMRFTPAEVSVAAGDRLVIDLVNEDATTSHDLVLDNGVRSDRLSPGASERLDVGVVGSSMAGWCSVVGHRQMGMVFAISVTGAAGSDTSAHAHPSAPTSAGGSAPAAPLDLHGSPSSAFIPVEAVLVPAPAGREHHVTLTVTETELEVAPGVWQRRWTYNGRVPGPTLRGKVGDVFVVTLVNDGTIGHSIDFHAGALAPDRPMRTIAPGERLVYRFTATRSGIWMYHCSTMPMSSHIAAGMHGAVVIDPPDLAPVDREYLLVQSEVFLGSAREKGHADEVDADKVGSERPDAVVFNGVANQYDHVPLVAKVGERVRVWVLDAGPNRSSSFHIVGGQFDTTYLEGRYLLRNGVGRSTGAGTGGSQALGLMAAQGGFVELTFPEPGRYPLVSHIMVDAERGAHGLIRVTR